MTPDDWRNFGWRLTEKLRVKVEWAIYLIDLRIGFRSGGKWKIATAHFWTPVTQNFWNGIFTLNIYVIKTHLLGISILLPRVGVVIRFSHDWWFQFGIGYLFDRGEFGFKCIIANWYGQEKYNPGCNAYGWDEGPV